MALGKGLSALIPDKPQHVVQDNSDSKNLVQELPINLIQDNRYQPRQNYDESHLNDLVLSIKEKGFLQPIVVRRVNDKYEVIAGERRLKAARKLELANIPVIVRQATDKEALELALVENIQREDLNPVEKALSYQRFINEFGYTQEEVAKTIGKDRVTVANSLRILKLPDNIRQGVIDRKITEGHARALLSVDDPNEQMMLFLETVQKDLSVRELESRSGLLNKKISKANNVDLNVKDVEIVSLEEELRQIFGTKVRVKNKRGNKGHILIEYYSLQDFDRILRVFKS